MAEDAGAAFVAVWSARRAVTVLSAERYMAGEGRGREVVVCWRWNDDETKRDEGLGWRSLRRTRREELRLSFTCRLLYKSSIWPY